MAQVAQNPNYSAALFRNEDPIAYLQGLEAQWHAAASPREGLGLLARVAKAALEARENQKAHDYAVEALSIADAAAADRQRRGFKNPRRFGGIPTTDYYGNFVLGRLALLGGDIRSAEQYLIVSGRTFGDAVLRSYGPNMSLAYELLRRGDHQSWQAVLTFLDEIKVFWAINPAHFATWSAEISAGKIPNFQAAGPNLYY
jgi:hypothetical protein